MNYNTIITKENFKLFYAFSIPSRTGFTSCKLFKIFVLSRTLLLEAWRNHDGHGSKNATQQQ